MLTTDPIYWQPYKPTITITDAGSTTTYYVYNGLTDTITTGSSTAKPVYCRVQLGTNHQGIFEVQFDNSTLSFDTANIKNGQKCVISLSKDSTLSNNILLRGLIRRTGYDRGIGGKALFTISGSSHAIRFSELVTYVNRTAAVLATGALDITDASMKADTLLQDIINISTESSFYSASSLATNSDVETFIPSLTVEYGEYQDIINLIEEQTTGEFLIDNNNVAILRHQFQPFTSGRGFILTDTVGSVDNADYTAYISPNSLPNYTESKYKSDGFANRDFTILSANQRPNNASELGLQEETPVTWDGNVTTGLEIAYKFTPQHSRFLPGDFYIVGKEWDTAGGGTPPAIFFKVCLDSGGLPQNTNGIIGFIVFSPNNFDNPQLTAAEYRLFNDHYLAVGTPPVYSSSMTLDTTKDYWLIASNRGFLSTTRFAWAFDSVNGSVTGVGAHHTANFSTNSNGGSSWSTISGKPCIGIDRYRSLSFVSWDPKSVAATGSGITTTGGIYIDSTLSNAASTIKTKDAMYEYLSNQLYLMARPKIIWSTMIIDPPNVPILPNDPLMIVDNTLGFSTTGQQVQTATVGDMTYEFGTRGGEGNVFQSNLYLNITPVGITTRYN